MLILCQVEDAVSRAADGTSVSQELDFSSLRSQLGPLAAVSEYSHLPYFSSFKGELICFLVANRGLTADMLSILPDSSMHRCCCVFFEIRKYVSEAFRSGNVT